MLQHTPLYEMHKRAGATLVDFSGWEMPLHYGSQIEEHHFVRRSCGMFDVSHMVVTDLKGEQVQDFLRFLLANDVAKLKGPGKAIYSCMLNEQGGVIDDLIVYWLGPNDYRLITNAGTRDKDMPWIKKIAQNFKVTLTERNDLSILAVQGPQAREYVAQTQTESIAQAILALSVFGCSLQGHTMFARTGYTGEDGFEIVLPAADIPVLWEKLVHLGVHPCGLGARDTLRLEAGLNLYGQDMDEEVSPYAANLSWTIALEPTSREFIGRKALEQQKQNNGSAQLVGLILLTRGVLRHGQSVFMNEHEVGTVTSGTYSPTLERAIALARIQPTQEQQCEVMIRDKRVPAKIVKPPFARHGKALYD